MRFINNNKNKLNSKIIYNFHYFQKKYVVDHTAQHFSHWTFPEGFSALAKCRSLISQNLKLLCCVKYKHSENLNNNRNGCSSHFSNVHIYFMNCY